MRKCSRAGTGKGCSVPQIAGSMVTETAEPLQNLWKFKSMGNRFLWNINMERRRQGYDKEFSEAAWGRERVMSQK